MMQLPGSLEHIGTLKTETKREYSLAREDGGFASFPEKSPTQKDQSTQCVDLAAEHRFLGGSSIQSGANHGNTRDDSVNVDREVDPENSMES